MKKRYSILIALFISLFIYLFYRSEKTVVNELIMLILPFDSYSAIKCSILKTLPLNDAIVYSLPGGLWIFCVTALSKDFYLEIRNHKMQVIFLPVLFAIALEFCQLFQLTNGRFDIWDIAFYLLFWLLATYSSKSQRSQQNIMSPFTLDSFVCIVCFLSVYLAHVSY